MGLELKSSSGSPIEWIGCTGWRARSNRLRMCEAPPSIAPLGLLSSDFGYTPQPAWMNRPACFAPNEIGAGAALP